LIEAIMADRLESRSESHGADDSAVTALGTNSFASALRVKAFTVVSREKPLSSPVKVGGTQSPVMGRLCQLGKIVEILKSCLLAPL